MQRAVQLIGEAFRINYVSPSFVVFYMLHENHIAEEGKINSREIIDDYLFEIHSISIIIPAIIQMRKCIHSKYRSG